MKKILYFLVILIIVAPIHLIEAQNSQKNKYKTSGSESCINIPGRCTENRLDSDQFVPYVTHQFANGMKRLVILMAFCSSSLPMVKVIIMPMDMPKSRHGK